MPIPSIIAIRGTGDNEIIDFMGAREVKAGTEASVFLQANDVILSFNNKPVNNLNALLEARISVIGINTEVVIFRNQKEV